MVSMLRELVSALSGQDIFAEVLAEFERMLRLTASMVKTATSAYWSDGPNASRDALLKQDIEVNAAERRIRKLLVVRTVAGSESDATYTLRLMSLVKDVERLGDYAKNMAELGELAPGALPDNAIVRKLRSVSDGLEEFMGGAIDAFVRDDPDSARSLIARGRVLVRQCDEVVKSCAASDFAAGTAVRVVLGARFNKRIVSHLLNVLSSLIMPLHELDFFEQPSG